MSAFECSKKHFETVRTSLEHQWNLYRDQNTIYNQIFWPNGIDQVYEDIKKLVEVWQRLQMETVAYKYADEDENTGQKVERKLQFSGEFEAGDKLNRPELYKALQCVRYQIEMEHLPREATKLEKDSLETLEQLINGLPKDIVHDMQDYEDARWAIA